MSRRIGDLAIRGAFAAVVTFAIVVSMFGLFAWVPAEPIGPLPRDALGILWGWAWGSITVMGLQSAGLINLTSPKTNKEEA